MSRWQFNNVQKAKDEVILYFNDTTQPLWGSTMSVTIPAADAQKLLTRLQAILHPGKHP
jgi:hypothetical protein